MVFLTLLNRFVFHIMLNYDGIMGCRKIFLENAVQGLTDSGIPLVAEVENSFSSAGFSDDIGIYYWIPQIVRWFNVSIFQAYNSLSIVLFLSSILLGTIGIFLCFERLIPRLIGLLTIVLWFLTNHQGFELNYAVSMLSVLGFVPLLLFLVKKLPQHTIIFALFMVFSGMVMGYFHYIRALSPLSTIAIMLTMILLSPSISKMQKSRLTLALVLGISFPILHFSYLKNTANELVSPHQSVAERAANFQGHPLWHSVYIGLGGIQPNPYGIEYSDTVAAKAVAQVDPNVQYLSLKYNEILKQLYIKKIKEHATFYIKQIFLKIKIICFNLPNFYWILLGITAAIVRALSSVKKSKTMEEKYFNNLNIAFILGIGLSLLPGIFVVPNLTYVSNFFILAYLYAAFGFVSLWQFASSMRIAWPRPQLPYGGLHDV